MQLKELLTPMPKLPNIHITINGHQSFFLHKQIMSKYSERLKKMIRQSSVIEIDDFPGGPFGFELFSRFCYSHGRIQITPSNAPLLHCCSLFLGNKSLFQKTASFLEEILYSSMNEIITALKSCELFLGYADSCGLTEKLICGVLAKIAQKNSSDLLTSFSSFSFSSSSSSSSSSNSPTISASGPREWWFDELTVLPPQIIEKIIMGMGAFGNENHSLILSRFLLHYLKKSVQKTRNEVTLRSFDEYTALAETAVYGVIFSRKSGLSCRKLLWLMRMVSGFGINKECRDGLEKMIGETLDQATLDDLLVSAATGDHGGDSGRGGGGGVYDVKLVMRLIKIFVNSEVVSVQKMKKLGRLMDKYLGEISPDQNLNISNFLGVVESLPDFARDCCDGVYRAVDIYLQSHPTLSFKERSKLCRCLNYEKLTLEACKDLAKNPRIPPDVAIRALMSQRSKYVTNDKDFAYHNQSPISGKGNSPFICTTNDAARSFPEENSEIVTVNIQKMQWKVAELEKVCREMKGQMRKMVRHAPVQNRTNLPRLC